MAKAALHCQRKQHGDAPRQGRQRLSGVNAAVYPDPDERECTKREI